MLLTFVIFDRAAMYLDQCDIFINKTKSKLLFSPTLTTTLAHMHLY